MTLTLTYLRSHFSEVAVILSTGKTRYMDVGGSLLSGGPGLADDKKENTMEKNIASGASLLQMQPDTVRDMEAKIADLQRQVEVLTRTVRSLQMRKGKLVKKKMSDTQNEGTEVIDNRLEDPFGLPAKEGNQKALEESQPHEEVITTNQVTKAQIQEHKFEKLMEMKRKLINITHDEVDRLKQKMHLSHSEGSFLDQRKMFENKEAETSSEETGPESKDTVYPVESNDFTDRILEQLDFVPESVREAINAGRDVSLKKIFLSTGVGSWVKRGQETFLEQQCKVPYCDVTNNVIERENADVVLLRGLPTNFKKSPGQIWMLYMLESPDHSPIFQPNLSMFNWTATYRHDSTIVAPYEKFVPYNSSVLTRPQTRNYAEGKTKKVAWFVSNCNSGNHRMEYATELGKYIDVDIYGACGMLTCPKAKSSDCFEMLNKDYKFYLSFENSNCRDYITEKFFVNGLKHDVLPIVMGAAPEDYARAAPPHSHIHVDQFSGPQALARYLHILDQNDNLYNQYFLWKGTGDMINTLFWCRVCAMAHDVPSRGHSWYSDVNAWWRGEDVCIGQSTWRERPPTNKLIGPLPEVLHPGPSSS